LNEQKKHHQPFPEEDNGEAKAPAETGSYSMVPPRFRDVYFQFYKETYRPNTAIDRKTKELIAIAASVATKCQGCLDGHVKKAIKFGASREEVGEAVAIAIGVNAAAIVDFSDLSAERLDLKLF